MFDFNVVAATFLGVRYIGHRTAYVRFVNTESIKSKLSRNVKYIMIFCLIVIIVIQGKIS